jgi:hypothetical protein
MGRSEWGSGAGVGGRRGAKVLHKEGGAVVSLAWKWLRR